MRFIFILTLVFSSHLFSAESKYRDRGLKKSEAPAFLIKATESEGNIEDIEYFVKEYREGRKTYEVKFEKNDEEVSLSFSEEGRFIEREEDIPFKSLSQSVKDKLNAYFGSGYRKYKIHETELRTTGDKKYIDVEVFHDGEITELSFTPEGEFVSEEKEKVPTIETLN
jgi:hypothetical protein